MANEPEAFPRRTGWLSIFLVLFASFLTMILATAVGVGYGVHRYWRAVLREEIQRDLTAKSRMFAARVDTDREHKIADITSQEGLHAGARATVIDTNGKALADSEVPLASLENEGRRPEFVAALRGEIGVDARRRNAFGTPVLYVAVPVSGGSARLAYPLADIEIASAHARHVLWLGAGIAILAALAISALAAQTVTRTSS